MTSRATLVRWDDVPLERVTEMVACKRIPGDQFTHTQVYIKKGALVPLHSHAREQVITVLEGALRFSTGDTVTVREGGVLRIPPGLPHQGEALEDSVALVVRGTEPEAPAG